MMTELNTVGINRIPGKYVLSLMASGAVPAERLTHLKAEISAEFAELCGQFTRRESGSVSEENAEMIMFSVLYTADSYLLSVGDRAAAAALVSEKFHDIYMKGCGVLSEIIGEGERLSRMAYKTRLNVETPSYRFVCEKAFGEFLAANKQIRFDCGNIFTSIDYPLLSDITDIWGAWYMREYYRRLYAENSFCRQFGDEKIITVLKNYAAGCGLRYYELFDNICGIFCENILWQTISGGDILTPFDRKEITKLQSRFSEMDETERRFAKADISAKCSGLFGSGYVRRAAENSRVRIFGIIGGEC
ncbi:MAG: hypothetical protein J5999_06855 [Oscillospiraceae bacterium]|nr:hypothetical protein [Oscillospiraceae bacterium]